MPYKNPARHRAYWRHYKKFRPNRRYWKKGVTNKWRLAYGISPLIGMGRESCAIVVRTIFDVVIAALKRGENVKIDGFGTFEPIDKKARRYSWGITIPARTTVKFTPHKDLKNIPYDNPGPDTENQEG